MNNQPVAMRQNLVPAAGGQSGWRANDRNGRIFQLADSLLEAVEKAVYAVPVSSLDIGAEGVQIDTG